MSSWSFPRFSSRRRPHPTETSESSPPGNEDGPSNPPRYSNLSLSIPPSSPPPPEVSSYSVPVEYADFVSSRPRSVDRISQLSSPTYVTYDDPDNRSISASTTTLTNPPRYSGLSNAPNPSGQEYSYTICRGFKSEPWATLRLYDVGASAPKRGRNPCFTNRDDMLGNVELTLPSPQFIKNIELVVRQIQGSN